MSEKTSTEKRPFHPQMTVGEALDLHEDAALVFSSYKLTNCSSCSLSEMETIAQVCSGYGVPLDQLIDSLNNLID